MPDLSTLYNYGKTQIQSYLLQLTDCALKNPCKNGGGCSVGWFNDIRCACADGFAGPSCTGEYLIHMGICYGTVNLVPWQPKLLSTANKTIKEFSLRLTLII